jgi:hypothetical protein
MATSPLPDPWSDILGTDLPPTRRKGVLAAFADVLTEIEKLRELDLTDVHPCVIFEPTAPYRLPRKD